MKIAVCVKICDGELNPFDGAALECALRLGSEVVAVSMCPPSAENELKRLTRLGIKVIHISDRLYAGADTLATGRVLAKAMELIKPDIVFCGRQSVDGDTAQVGPCLSALMNVPVITNVMEITSLDENEISCRTRTGNFGAELPCVITIERICSLRFPALRSRASEPEVWDNSVLQLDEALCGLKGSPTRVMKVFENKAGRRKCTFIDMQELLPLVKRLKEEKKEKIVKNLPSEKKFPEIWTVGKLDLPYEIAESVKIIEEKDPRKIASMAEKQRPEVILWNADLWGRSAAPVTAAMLGTGLCADCTALETDGKRLFMYRPARSGSVTAKIECLTNPQMATVRTDSVSSDIIVSGGRGVLRSLDRLEKLAESLGAELGASRGLVDSGGVSYDRQIGLTGKTVSPEIYIAVGISGAVHHTCAIENAGTVIAVNPDKNARIFDYADYGIIAEI